MTSPPLALSPRTVRWLLIAALLPFAALILTRWNHPPSATDGDYAQYLLHAKALAEGRPYTDIGYIYTPTNLVGPAAQPPGWPLVLAPFVAIFGTHSAVFKLLVTALVAAFGVTAGLYFVRRGDAMAGIAVAGIVPLALETDYVTSSALSDPLFCVLVWVLLLVADANGPVTWRRGIALTLLSAAALSVRVVGIAVLPALALHSLFTARAGRIKVLIPMLALLVGAALFALSRPDSIPFLERALDRSTAAPLLTVMMSYRSALATGALYPFPPSHVANDIYHAAMLIPIAIGAVLFVRKSFTTALFWFVVVYIGMLLFSPVRDPRYAWPLVPLLVACMVSGCLWIAGRVVPERGRTAIPAYVGATVALLMIGAAFQQARQPARRSLIGDPDTVALFDWARATGDSSDIRVVFTNPRVLTLETDVPAMGIPFGTPTEVLAELGRKRITHVVVQRQFHTRQAERDLVELVAQRPEWFPPVFANATYDVRRFTARSEPAQDSGSFAVLRSQ